MAEQSEAERSAAYWNQKLAEERAAAQQTSLSQGGVEPPATQLDMRHPREVADEMFKEGRANGRRDADTSVDFMHHTLTEGAKGNPAYIWKEPNPVMLAGNPLPPE